MTQSLQSSSGATDPFPQLGSDGRIVEGLVTTLHADGTPHLSPMGPIVDQPLTRLHLRPFQTSTTYANLKRTRQGVFHITDDVELIARAAIGKLDALPSWVPADKIEGVILTGACRWYAFSVETIDRSSERTNLFAHVIDSGVRREFLGFNRAKHAVIEAAILATRLHILPPEEIRQSLAAWAPLVDKTGAAEDHAAFALVNDYIERGGDPR